jgi:hypothetical protein
MRRSRRRSHHNKIDSINQISRCLNPGVTRTRQKEDVGQRDTKLGHRHNAGIIDTDEGGPVALARGVSHHAEGDTQRTGTRITVNHDGRSTTEPAVR